MSKLLDNDAPLFLLFWENGKLHARNARAFAAQLENDAGASSEIAALHTPILDGKLPRANDPLAKLMHVRQSRRDLSSASLDERQLGSLCEAFAQRADGGRNLPSAGGKYPVEVFAFVLHARSPLAGSVVYYDGPAHALCRVAACPPWETLREALGVEPERAMPSVVFVFVGMPSRVASKYGERGGRFLLIEVGHAAEALALRIAHEELKGWELGGLFDDRVKSLLTLDGTDALIALGYAVGA